MLLSLFRVSGNSMLPSFKTGQILLVSSIPYLFSKPKIGDVVVVKDPRSNRHTGSVNSNRLLLKRIKTIMSSPRKRGSSKNWIPDQVGNDSEYFISGDNPDESTDSRIFGAVGRKNILGKVL